MSLKSAALALALTTALTPAALADPAMWRVSDADSDIYLFGSVHILPPDTVWRTQQLDQLIETADSFYYEIPMTADAQTASQSLIPQYGLNRNGNTLDGFLNEAERVQLDRVATSLGLSSRQLQPLQPWLASITLSVLAMQAQGYNPASGVEATLSRETADERENAFETYNEQFGFFSNLSQEVQTEFLRLTLDQLENEPDMLDELVSYWAVGDTEGLNTLFHASMMEAGQEVYDALIVNRNTNWANDIVTQLEGDGTTLIIVGAGHLVGPDSVPQMLEDRGLTVERVQ